MSRKPTRAVSASEAVLLLKEELNDARQAVLEFQHIAERAVRCLDRVQTVLRVSSEAHLLRADDAHAILAGDAARDMILDVEELRKLSKISIDDAISHLTIPF